MGEGKYKKCFQDLSECQLFLEFPFNNFSFQLFFFKAVLLPYISLLKIWWEPFLFSSFWYFSFLFFFLWILFFLFFFSSFGFFQFFFSFFFEFSHKPPHWNKLIKFHLETLWIRALRKKERLIKRLNGVTSDNVSRKKKKNTYMAQSRQKWPNLISQRLV